jgi:hypothetical protein
LARETAAWAVAFGGEASILLGNWVASSSHRSEHRPPGEGGRGGSGATRGVGVAGDQAGAQDWGRHISWELIAQGLRGVSLLGGVSY